MLSSLLITNKSGDILVQNVFRGDVLPKSIQLFCQKVIRSGQFIFKPILLFDETSFIAVPHKNVVFLATTKSNINVAMVL